MKGVKKNPNAVALGKLGGEKFHERSAEDRLKFHKAGGKAGGAARAASLTPEERSAIAKKAAAKRWGAKKKGGKNG